jgi:hypothetical protein
MKFEIEVKYSSQTLLQISALINIWAAKMENVAESREIKIDIRTYYIRSPGGVDKNTWKVAKMAMTKVENKEVILTGELQL